MIRKQRIVAATGALALLASMAPTSALAADGGTYVVDTTVDSNDASPGDGDCADADGSCSLRAAIQEANAHVGSSVIKLRTQTYTLDLTGAGEDAAATGDLDVTADIVIKGRRAVIDLSGSGDRAFDVAAGANLHLSKIDIRNGAPAETESGGAIRNAGTLTVDNSDLSGNTVVGAGASGGAIANSGTLTVLRSTLTGNSAARAGGAIEATSGSSTTIARSTLSDNEAGPMPGNGGAFHLTGAGTVDVSQSNIHDNTAANEGGGLWNSALGTMTVDRVDLVGNTANGIAADAGGGAIFNQGNGETGGTLSVTRSTLKGNSATEGSGSGGGILNENGDLSVEQTRFVDNSAARAGGGIETVAGTVSMQRSWMIGNEAGPAPGNGGGIHVSGPGIVDVSRTYFGNNTAANEGGALWNSAVGTMTLDRITARFNDANGTASDNGGGALFNQGNGETGGTLTVTDSEISKNSANDGSGSGGGILNENGTLTVSGSDIWGNDSARAGGGIETVGGTVQIDGVRLDRNTTGSAPGNGGGLHISGPGNVSIDDSRVTANTAANEGGGLWNSTVGTLTVTDTVIARNKVGVPGNGPNVFQQAPVDGGVFTVDGEVVPEGPNTI